jgi:hypothetical protein
MDVVSSSQPRASFTDIVKGSCPMGTARSEMSNCHRILTMSAISRLSLPSTRKHLAKLISLPDHPHGFLSDSAVSGPCYR